MKGPDYRFIDINISEFFTISGSTILCHLYLGPYQQQYELLNRDGSKVPAADPNTPAVDGDLATIEDALLMENRDRKYSDITYELRGIYTIQDIDFDLRQFGIFLTNDTLFIEFHLNDMVTCLGRRLMPGDVLELPHRRDDTMDIDGPAINKFYVIEDASRASDGYSATWYPHIWRVKVAPMPATQEFADILNQQAKDPLGFNQGDQTLGDIMSTTAIDQAINDAVDDQAREHVKKRYFETQQFWMVIPEGAPGGSNPWVFAGDAIPPNGAIPLGSGNRFPQNPQEGDYYVRTDYAPRTLFMFDKGAWREQEQDIRGAEWTAVHNLMLGFIQESGQSTFNDGTTAPTRVALSKAVNPRADF